MVNYPDANTGEVLTNFIDKKLIKIWDGIKDGELERKHEDRVYLVDGREGSGKSFFAIQQAKYIDPTFSANDVYFSPEKFLHAIRTAKSGKVIIFDEAFRGLSSKGTRSKVNRAIVQALMEVRQRSLIIFIVLPTIFLLEIYAACFRSEALFHIYKLKKAAGSGERRRAFKIYNYNKKMQLYLRGKNKYFSYAYPRIKMAKGMFLVNTLDNGDKTPYKTFDLAKYRHEKNEAFKENGEKDEIKQDNTQRNICIYILYKQFVNNYAKLSRILTENGYEVTEANLRFVVKEVEKARESTDSTPLSEKANSNRY